MKYKKDEGFEEELMIALPGYQLQNGGRTVIKRYLKIACTNFSFEVLVCNTNNSIHFDIYK